MTAHLPKEQFQLGECLRKYSSPSMTHALNRAWLLGHRAGIYPCCVCHGYHSTHQTNGKDVVVCSLGKS